MRLDLKKTDLKDIKDEILAIALFKDEKLPFPELTKKMRKGEFEAKLGQIYSVDTQGKAKFRKLLLYGLGEEKDFDPDFLRRFGGAAVRYAANMKSKMVSISADVRKIPADESAQAIAEGAVLASYRPLKFKTKKEDYFQVEGASLVTKKNAAGALKRALILANSQNYVRDLNENPANIATPAKVVEFARSLAKEKKFSIAVFGKNELKKMKMNAILAVNQGSILPPFMVIIEYNKGKKNLPLYAVVGKGITFDSGGISLKPSKGMQEMKYDKSGAITVLGIMKAVSELSLPIRLMGAFAVTENLPSGSAQKPGDIITSYSGKTIEVLNTDAEGRLILADVLAYMAEKKPKAIIDLATLTGAIIVSLGRHRIGLFSNNDRLAETIFKSGEKTFERVWRMPLDKEYIDMNKADFADIKNIGSETGEAGSITAAAFLSEFIGETKWAHLDIAGVDRSGDKHGYLEKGASGIGVRLVVGTLERLAR